MKDYRIEVIWDGKVNATYVITKSGKLLERATIKKEAENPCIYFDCPDRNYMFPFHMKNISEMIDWFAANGFELMEYTDDCVYKIEPFKRNIDNNIIFLYEERWKP